MKTHERVQQTYNGAENRTWYTDLSETPKYEVIRMAEDGNKIQAITTGRKTMTTTGIIFSVSGLEDAFCAVILYVALKLDGNIFGYMPVIPKKVTPIIAAADENQALK